MCLSRFTRSLVMVVNSNLGTFKMTSRKASPYFPYSFHLFRVERVAYLDLSIYPNKGLKKKKKRKKKARPPKTKYFLFVRFGQELVAWRVWYYQCWRTSGGLEWFGLAAHTSRRHLWLWATTPSGCLMGHNLRLHWFYRKEDIII